MWGIDATRPFGMDFPEVVTVPGADKFQISDWIDPALSDGHWCHSMGEPESPPNDVISGHGSYNRDQVEGSSNARHRQRRR